MTTTRPWRTAVICAASWLVGLSAVSLQASEIRDDAKFFTEATVAKATQDLKALEKNHRLSMNVETHPVIPADKKGSFNTLDKSGRERFFSDWTLERARESKARGIFVLITKEPGHVQLIVSPNLRERGFSEVQRTALRDSFLKSFREKKFDQGLVNAVSYLESASLRLKDSRLVPTSAPIQHRPAANQNIGVQNMGIWSWVILGVVVWLVFSIVSSLIRGASGMSGAGSYGQPGYGGAGYGGGYGGGGGGFMSNMFGGLAGAMAGNWLYNSMFNNHGSNMNAGFGSSYGDGSTGIDQSAPDDFSSGGDFSGGDFGGGGDYGGGDFGGGDFGGGGDF